MNVMMYTYTTEHSVMYSVYTKTLRFKISIPVKHATLYSKKVLKQNLTAKYN